MVVTAARVRLWWDRGGRALVMPQDDELASRSSAEWFRISGAGWQYLPGTPVRLSQFVHVLPNFVLFGCAVIQNLTTRG
jgi:hypothetical protein